MLAKLELAAKQEEVYLTSAQVWQENWERQRKAQAEWDARQRKEVQEFKELMGRAKQWKQAQLLREYIDSVTNAGDDWTAWAHHKADWLDPNVMADDEWLRLVNKSDHL